MEIIELIFAGVQLCGCFLDLAALLSGGAAGYSGVQTYRHRKDKPADKSPISQMVTFIVLLVVAFVLILLVVLKYAAA